MYSLSYNSITHIKNVHAPTHLAGSSYYKHINNKLVTRAAFRENKDTSCKLFSNFIEACSQADYYNLGRDLPLIARTLTLGDLYVDSILKYRAHMDLFSRPNPKVARTYKLNKSKVRKKMAAFTRLNQTKKFIGFYSISFPSSASDDVLYTIFNRWLTNLRKTYSLKSYIWVAERQKNNTIHFHMLTNNWLPIRKVNAAMAIAINTSVKSGLLSWGSSSVETYNGVDVDSPQFPKKRKTENREEFRRRKLASKKMSISKAMQWISKYMIKYVTKNDIEFPRLAYHSSRDISRLFTSKVINDNHIDNFAQHLPDDSDSYFIFENETIECLSFRFNANDDLYKLIDSVNNDIFYMYHNNIKPPE